MLSRLRIVSQSHFQGELLVLLLADLFTVFSQMPGDWPIVYLRLFILEKHAHQNRAKGSGPGATKGEAQGSRRCTGATLYRLGIYDKNAGSGGVMRRRGGVNKRLQSDPCQSSSCQRSEVTPSIKTGSKITKKICQVHFKKKPKQLTSARPY